MTDKLTKEEILDKLQVLFSEYSPRHDEKPRGWEWPDRGSEYKVHELINDIREDLDKEPI